jgi:Bacterial surface proteins containing Ig-like domains
MLESLKKRLTGRKAKLGIPFLLALALLVQPFAGMASAQETVQSIYFQSVPNPLQLEVDDAPYALRVWANITGGTVSTKEVTNEASWTSSNSKVVKVDKGVLTALTEGYADITATYKTAAPITLRVNVSYAYDKVEIGRPGDAAPAPSALDVELGETPSFTLVAHKGTTVTDVTDDAVWTTSNSSVATVSKGKVTLVASGTATITAKYKGRSDTIKLDVTSPYKSMTLTPDSMLEFKTGDADRQLTATALRKTGENEDVTDEAAWTSGNPSVATVKDGKVTPVGPGTTTVQASYLGVSKSVTVIVRLAHEAMNLSVDKPLHLLVSEEPQQLRVTVADDPDMEPIDVTDAAKWESSNLYVATVEGGLLKPMAPGTAKITASYKGLSRSVQVTVYPSIGKVVIVPEKVDGFVGGEGDLPKAEGTDLSGAKVDVTNLAEWTSSNPDVVTVENGKWVARKTGTATLTAAVKNRSDSVTIVIHEKPLLLLSDMTDVSVIKGKEASLPKLTMVYENGEEADDIGDLAEWKSSTPNVLIKDGKIKGLVPSKATLTATYLGKKATVRVTVEEEIVRMVVEPESLELFLNRSKSIRVTGYYKNGQKVSIGSKMNWSVSSPELASVKGSTVKALAEGTGILTGTYQGKTVKVPLVVKPKLKKIVPSVPSLQLKVGDQESVTLRAEYEGGKTVDVTSGAVWTSSNSKVVTVTAGRIVVTGKGKATVKAIFDGKTATVRITVK